MTGVDITRAVSVLSMQLERAFGFGFIMLYTGALALLFTLRSRLLTPEGVQRNIALLKTATAIVAVLSWLAVFVGT